MADEWHQETLSKLCSYINRGAAPVYTTGRGLLVLNQKCIRDQRLDFEEARRTDQERKAVSSDRMLRRWDILVNSTGVGTLGRVAQVESLPEPVTVDSHITIVRPNPSVIHPRFLGFVVRSIEREIEALAEGSTGQTELARARLQSLLVPVAPEPDQGPIAYVLGSLDDKIELNRRINETLEGMARALFNSWFVEFDPVRAKAEGGEPGLPQSLASLFPVRLVGSKVGGIPEGWRVAPLPELIDVNPPRSLRKGTMAPYLDMANMPTRGHVPDRVVDRSFGSGMRFTNGDTLVARITPCLENGKTAFVDFLEEGRVGWGSTEYIVLRSKPPFPEEFAYCLARSVGFREFAIQSMTGSSGRQRVPSESLTHFQVPVAPDPVAVAFGRLVKPHFARASAAIRESRTLAAVRDALLPKLISGELRVKDAEKFIKPTIL
jgi:type I restriction enzyme S subunit